MKPAQESFCPQARLNSPMKRSSARLAQIRRSMRALSWLLLALLCLSLPGWGQQQPRVRGLLAVFTSSQPRSTVLPANLGWQPIYTVEVPALEGDVLRLVGQTQLTVDASVQVGQQLRLTVNGEPVGFQTIEINSYTGSHHLPMMVYALAPITVDGAVTVTLEGSSFQSDGDFQVAVDNQSNLAYGSLIVEQYRTYDDLQSAWNAGALLLTEIHQPVPLTQEAWCQLPYVQQTLADVKFPANAGDVLRPSGRAVATSVPFGHEQFAGVLTADERPISPYGGQNVDPENVYVPMLIEGFDKVAQDSQQFLEYRVYGAFGHGLALLPETPRFEVAHFGSYGRGLSDFGQDRITVDGVTSNVEPVEVLSREIDLESGDLLRLTANLQFAPPDSVAPVTIETGMRLQVDGPSGTVGSYAVKNLTPIKAALPLTDFLTVRAETAGRYRVSLKASGKCQHDAVPLRLDAANSQLQYLRFSMPG